MAVVLLRSFSDSEGPALAAQILIVLLVLALTALAGLAAWALTRCLLRLSGCRQDLIACRGLPGRATCAGRDSRRILLAPISRGAMP